jgi:hypothetical protein
VAAISGAFLISIKNIAVAPQYRGTYLSLAARRCACEFRV